jgi:hypothetical protein
MEHEHIMKLAEAGLAIFGTMKFCHEVYEVIHHLFKLKRILKF